MSGCLSWLWQRLRSTNSKQDNSTNQQQKVLVSSLPSCDIISGGNKIHPVLVLTLVSYNSRGRGWEKMRWGWKLLLSFHFRRNISIWWCSGPTSQWGLQLWASWSWWQNLYLFQKNCWFSFQNLIIYLIACILLWTLLEVMKSQNWKMHENEIKPCQIFLHV